MVSTPSSTLFLEHVVPRLVEIADFILFSHSHVPSGVGVYVRPSHIEECISLVSTCISVHKRFFNNIPFSVRQNIRWTRYNASIMMNWKCPCDGLWVGSTVNTQDRRNARPPMMKNIQPMTSFGCHDYPDSSQRGKPCYSCLYLLSSPRYV